MRNEKLYRRVVNWDDLPTEVVRPGVRRSSYATDEVQLVLNICDEGMQLNPHVHEDFDQLAVILSGHARYYIDGVPYEMGPGSILLVPAGSPHYIEPLEKGVANLDIFAPPRADLLHLVSYLDEVRPPAPPTA
jgi:mannose-6-phosphate isomerase-like protein (cupin superfamily)